MSVPGFRGRHHTGREQRQWWEVTVVGGYGRCWVCSACNVAPPRRVATPLHKAEFADVAGKQSHTLKAGVQTISSKDSVRGKVLKAVVKKADKTGVAAEFIEKRVEAACFLVAAMGKARDSVVAAAVSRAGKDHACVNSRNIRPRLKNEVSQRAEVRKGMLGG